jgi:hypothetical protein
MSRLDPKVEERVEVCLYPLLRLHVPFRAKVEERVEVYLYHFERLHVLFRSEG